MIFLSKHFHKVTRNCFLRYKASPEDVLLRAFRVLDQDNKGYLTEEELKNHMTKEGRLLHFFKCLMQYINMHFIYYINRSIATKVYLTYLGYRLTVHSV